MKQIVSRFIAIIVLHLAELAFLALWTIDEIVPIYVNGQKIIANECIRYGLFFVLIIIWFKAVFFLITGKTKLKIKKPTLYEQESIEEDDEEI